MPWISLTEAHLLESLAAAELSALRTMQTAPGQTDPLPEVLERTVGQVQGYVGTRYPVGQPGTIPDQLLSSAIAIARWRLVGRLPIKLMATDNRRQEYEDAIAELQAVAAGKFALSVATDPAENQPRPQAEGAWGSSDKLKF